MEINFRTKLSIGFILILALISVLSINFFYSNAHYILRENLRRRLIGIAATAALMIDGDQHELLREPSDKKNPVFKELRAILTRVKNANPGITYIYTMRKTDDPNTFEFVIDEGEEIDENENGIIDEEEETAEIGEPYDVSLYPELRDSYDGPTADRIMQTDQWGTWLSGYAPIYDDKMEPIGIVGIDMDAKDVKKEEAVLLYTALIIGGLALVGSILAGSLLSRHFTEPIKELLKRIQEITQGDLNTRIKIKRRDEIGKLGRAFNEMAASLSASRKELDEHNRLLEIKIKERTRELKEAHDIVLQSKKMAAVGKLASGVAHEFNNIFTCIRGSAELALRNSTTPKSQEKTFNLILKMSDRARVITKALAAYSTKKASVRKELFSLNEVLELCLSLYKIDLTELKITLIKDYKPLPLIWGDKEQLQTAFCNIVANAKDAMAESGGKLTIETGRKNGMLFIRISDTGPGVDPDILENIFEPFSGNKGVLAKGKKEYAGLGLFTASGIINNFGGEIKVEQTSGSGTSFVVFIPVPRHLPVEARRRKKPIAQEDTGIGTEVTKNRRILCVDDEEMIVETLLDYLQKLGYLTEGAFNGKDAIEKTRNTAYDVILMDLAMPDLDGESVIKKILEFRPTARFIIISGYYPFSLSPDISKNVFYFLQKPFELSRVDIAIRNALKGNPIS